MDILVSYLIGAVPTAYILGKLLKGIDLRRYGSGNVGATNAWRILGKRIGTATLMIDILKGVIAVTLIARFFPGRIIEDVFIRKFLCGIAAIIGHNFPVYLRFRGGKGVATSAGVFLGLAPKLLGIAALLWSGILIVTGYISLASMIAALSLPVLSILFNYPTAMHWFSMALGILILIQHRSNIRRLFKGEEKRFFGKIKK